MTTQEKIAKICNLRETREKFDYGYIYIVYGWSVYQMQHSANYNSDTHLTTFKVYTKCGGVPLANRGYYHIMNGTELNKLIGEDLLR